MTFLQTSSQTIQDGLVRGIEDAITGAKSLREALSGVLKSIGGTLLRSAITSAVGLTLVVVVVSPQKS